MMPVSRMLSCIGLILLVSSCGGGQRESHSADAPPSSATTDVSASDKVSADGEVTSARKFWVQFQSAVAGNDAGSIVDMARLPVEVRGQLDETPSRQVNESELRTMLPKLLDQDTGLQEQAQSMRHLIESTNPAKFSESIEEGHIIRLAVFQFEFANDEWLLTRVYLDE